MYVEVKTEEQQKLFELTWEYFCQKYGWYNDPYAANGIRYLLLAPNPVGRKSNRVIGTIEFIPYYIHHRYSAIEGRCGFSRYIDIAQHQSRSWEIDKLCIAETFQRKGYFDQFMPIFYEHAKKHKPKYYLSLIDQKLFRMLRISFGLPIEQRGIEQVGPKNCLVPAVFDVEQMLQNRAHVKTLLNKNNSTWGNMHTRLRRIFFH